MINKAQFLLIVQEINPIFLLICFKYLCWNLFFSFWLMDTLYYIVFWYSAICNGVCIKSASSSPGCFYFGLSWEFLVRCYVGHNATGFYKGLCLNG